MPPKTRAKGEERSRHHSAEGGGTVLVSSKIFESEEEFSFTTDPLWVAELERTIPSRTYRLVWIEELSAQGTVFGYKIFAEPIESHAEPEQHAHRQMITCFDSDGDGKFEQVVMTGTEPPGVPAWVFDSRAKHTL